MTDRELGRQTGRAIQSQGRMAVKSLGVEIELTPEETESLAIGAGLSPIADGQQWKAGLNLAEGTIVVFESVNYQVLQGHISQANWTPKAAPALFKKIAEDYAEWERPEGAHDAYVLGDKVTYNGKLWVCTGVDGGGTNSWAPGVYGWTEVTA